MGECGGEEERQLRIKRREGEFKDRGAGYEVVYGWHFAEFYPALDWFVDSEAGWLHR